MQYKRVTEPMTQAKALDYLKSHGAPDPAQILGELDRLAEAITKGEAFAVFVTLSRQTATKSYLNLYANHRLINDIGGVLGAGKYKGTGQPYTFKSDSPTAKDRYRVFQKLAYVLEQTHGIRVDFSSVPFF